MRFLLFIIALSYSLTNAQNVAFNPEGSKGELYEYASFFKTSKVLTIQDVIGNPNLKFNTIDSNNQSVGFTTDSYWIHFVLENSSLEPKTYYLKTARPITDIATLFQVKDSNIQVFKSGDQIPFSKRQVKHRQTIFKFTIPKQVKQQFYLHLKSDGETLNLPLNLYTEDAFWKENYSQQLFLGVFYGLLFLAVLVYFFFYTSLSKKTFLYYSIYVLSIAFLQSALDGFLFQYVFSNGGYFNDRIVLITALFSNFFLLKYCEHFLKIKIRTTIIHYGFKLIYSIIIILGILLFINDKTKALVYPISNVNGLLSLILILGVLFYMRYKRIQIDTFFSIGIFFLVIGLLGFVMNNLSLLPNNFIILNSAKFGIGLEVVFLSLSMTNLIRDLRLEKEESQKLALNKSEEVSELKSFFMSNMSHELRTPINAIMGIADDQLDKNKDEESYKNFEIIKQASISLLSNINDILDFEKIEKGQLKLRMQPFNPRNAIKQISDNWKIAAKRKGLQYVLNVSENIPKSVMGDGERFTQIINNILSNAVKFTVYGKIEFTVICTYKENNTHHFTLQVIDTGVGISDDKKNRLFDSFAQMRLNNTRRFGGIGLGLSIVKHLVELFKGNIVIDSNEGFGTKVTIDFNLEEFIDENKNKYEKSNVNTVCKVLVVEDNVMNQLIIKRILKSSKLVEITVASNGKKALEVLKKETFDIILMDLQMPIMDGYEAASVIRNSTISTISKDIPIIAVTADTTEFARDKVFNIGMNDYITKPINKTLLLNKIESYRKTS
ncbi:7TM diverse intracellular signaling domain-containing protein [Pontimicrobium sp. MEBiC06410]